jgi:hypothetical protein
VKIKVLPSALTDLDRGRQFHEQQEEVLGDYFLDSPERRKQITTMTGDRVQPLQNPGRLRRQWNKVKLTGFHPLTWNTPLGS